MSLVISSVFTYDTDAGNYIQAVETADGQALESATRKAINDFVIGCKQDGIWDAIKASCILSGARTLAGALVPLVGTAPTNFNFVAGDYNRKTGLLGNAGNKYLNSNRNNDLDPLTNKHVSVYVTLIGASSYQGHLVSQYTESAETIIATNWDGQAARFRLSANTLSTNINATTPSFPQLLGASRSSNLLSRRYNGATNLVSSSGTGAAASPIFVFGAGGGAFPDSDARLAFYSIGESLDLAKLDGRVTDLINKFSQVIP